MQYDATMKRIMDSDSNIRNCIVADTEGEIKAVMHRDGIRNYLSDEETSESLKFLFCILKYMTCKFCVVLNNGYNEKILSLVFSYKTRKLMNPSFAILHQNLIKK